MKKIIWTIFLWTFFVFVGIAQAAEDTAVFFIPHQDDEMYMLGAMHRALENKKDVYVVLATDGGNSNVRKDLEKELKKKITRREFVELRNKEFYRSLRTIGIAPDHVLFSNNGGINGTMLPQYRDGRLTYEDAYAIIQKFYDEHGSGVYATVLADAGHGDHRMLRDALVNFVGVSKKEYYSEVVNAGTKTKLTKTEQQAKNKAMAIYYRWDPAESHYAIAAHSVKKLLSFWRYHGYEYVSYK